MVFDSEQAFLCRYLPFASRVTPLKALTFCDAKNFCCTSPLNQLRDALSTVVRLCAAVEDCSVQAGVAELVDAPGLGPGDESCGGSSPSARTRAGLPTVVGACVERYVTMDFEKRNEGV
jgi:hypothetical protein